MKKGDQGGPLQPAVVDKCLEELFVAASEHATLNRDLATYDNLWTRVADQIGWVHLPPIIIRHLANHMVEARLAGTVRGWAGALNDSSSGMDPDIRRTPVWSLYKHACSTMRVF